jgi:hypothetical protein
MLVEEGVRGMDLDRHLTLKPQVLVVLVEVVLAIPLVQVYLEHQILVEVVVVDPLYIQLVVEVDPNQVVLVVQVSL